ncbi:MAG: carbon-nitrogen hydrolase family protein [Bacteroidota bacterium]
MKVKVALVQDSPVFFDKQRSLQKLIRLTREAAQSGSQLVLFPESFIPGYPRGFTFGTKVGSRTDEGRLLYETYYANSLSATEAATQQLAALARDCGIYLIVGATEKRAPHGSLYCSMFYFSPTSGLMGIHRKIKPTGQERIIWGEADGQSLRTFQTAIGKIGGLICWENYMPLARMAMYQKGVEIYLAPTADSRDNWTASLQHIALEGRCFVLGCNQYFTKSMYPKKYQHLVAEQPENMCRGGGMIVAPDGRILAGPLFDAPGILTAELDLTQIIRNKLDFDVIGHYSRQDIFNFSVNGQPEIQLDKGIGEGDGTTD